MAEALTGKRQQILEFIGDRVSEQGYPPSVREIGEAVGLTSSSTVHAHLAVLQREGYLRRDPTKPRAIEVRYDPSSKAADGRPAGPQRPARRRRGRRHRRAGPARTSRSCSPCPRTSPGTGSLFMLRVRGDSMIEAGIFDGDYVVVRQQPDAENGDIVVAGIPDDEATVKTFSRRGGKIVLTPANPALSPDGARPGGRDHLRQGRHRPAPPLTLCHRDRARSDAPGPLQGRCEHATTRRHAPR